MKQVMTLMLAWFMLAPSLLIGSVSAQENDGFAYVNSYWANIRSKPTSNSHIIDSIGTNYEVSVKKNLDNWWTEIAYGDHPTKTGFIRTSLLSNNRPEEFLNGWIYDATSNVFLRAQPNAASKIVLMLKKWDRVLSIDDSIVNNNWVRVKTAASGKIGYISKRYLAKQPGGRVSNDIAISDEELTEILESADQSN